MYCNNILVLTPEKIRIVLVHDVPIIVLRQHYFYGVSLYILQSIGVCEFKQYGDTDP